MPNVQIRHVPEDVHRTLKARAARAGKTLSDYLLTELEAVARRPTPEELFERISARGSVKPRMSSANAVRLERDARR
jgi:plasmid stability protein